MKKFFKNWYIYSSALTIVSWLFSGLEVSFQINDFLLTGLFLTLIIKLTKPIFNVVFLPINLITLGAFRWLRMVISFALLVYLIPGVKLQSFYFPGFNLNAIIIEPFNLSSPFSLVIAALFFNLCQKSIRWLFKKS